MRHSFSRLKTKLDIPDLASVQLESYEWFMTEGMQEILEELGIIEDYSGRGWVLTLSNPKVDKENLTIEEALHTGRTYDAPWYLISTLEDTINKKKKEQQIYMGDIPLMTSRGTFV